MGEIVNLRRARKARDRAREEGVAAANRALHGRTREERAVEERTRGREERLHEGHRLEGEE